VNQIDKPNIKKKKIRAYSSALICNFCGKEYSSWDYVEFDECPECGGTILYTETFIQEDN
jgi:rRNA maturation endonuclease Nob1